ncbi:MAG: redox-sensing transcriptional repressor Rex [Oscillospiraceae bacterium]|nr:redox-sensing transcriptional repressor Rex [Oscillospiraceae bacterium]
MRRNKSKEIPAAAAHRLPRYYRYLTELVKNERYRISSGELSKIMNVTASQIRQDLNCFGGFGQQGYGYNTEILRSGISRILGVEREFTAVIAGTGNLGKTLAKSGMFARRGVVLKALFDIDPAVIDSEAGGFVVMDIKEAADYCRDNKIDIAVLTLPKDETNAVANILAEAGVKGFWNFSNMELEIKTDKPGIKVQNMHMGDSLMRLCFDLNN